jgi:hypothetical protein
MRQSIILSLTSSWESSVADNLLKKKQERFSEKSNAEQVQIHSQTWVVGKLAK